MSALSRIAIDDHRHVKLAPEDTVVLSARSIPGNEKAIGRVINHVARRGATVIHEGIKHVHVSGHGSEEELKLMLTLVRPKYFIPVHGEYRQLAQHARVAGRVFAGRDPQAGNPADRKRRHRAHGREQRAGGRQGAGRPHPDRRHADRRNRRRGAARSAPPRRGRARGAGGRDQQADRRARRRARHHHARLRHGKQRSAARRRRAGASAR